MKESVDGLLHPGKNEEDEKRGGRTEREEKQEKKDK